MRPQSRLTGYLLILFVIYSASALVAQQYCLSGTVTETVGISSFRVGDPIALTMTLQPGSQSCEPLPEGLGTTCSAHAALQMQSGTRHWSSVGIPLEESAQIGAVSYTAPDKSITNISLDSDNALETSVHFVLSGFPGNLLAGGTLPLTFPSHDDIAASGAAFTLFVMEGGGPATISYTGQNCAGGCKPDDSFDAPIDFHNQEQGDWCWAAVTEMLIANADGKDVKQCEQAERAFSGLNCCPGDKKNMPPACNRPYPLRSALASYKYHCKNQLGGWGLFPNPGEIKQELFCKKHIIAFTWANDPKGFHPAGFHDMIIYGYETDESGLKLHVYNSGVNRVTTGHGTPGLTCMNSERCTISYKDLLDPQPFVFSNWCYEIHH